MTNPLHDAGLRVVRLLRRGRVCAAWREFWLAVEAERERIHDEAVWSEIERAALEQHKHNPKRVWH